MTQTATHTDGILTAKDKLNVYTLLLGAIVLNFAVIYSDSPIFPAISLAYLVGTFGYTGVLINRRR